MGRQARVTAQSELSNSFGQFQKRKNMKKTYSAFVASLSEEDRSKLTAELEPLTKKLTKQATEGTKATVAFGETACAIRKALAKAGAAGQVSNYCRDKKIVRSAFYNAIRVYQWEKLVPDEFKAIADKHGMSFDDAAQNAIIKIALDAENPGSVADADTRLIKLAAGKPPTTEDPVVAAITKAAHLLVAACKGQLDKVEDLCQYDETVGIAQSTLELTATNLIAASQVIAMAAFDEIKQLAAQREDLAKLTLPESATLTAAVADRVKQLTASNAPAPA
jgi:hypothetical protein